MDGSAEEIAAKVGDRRGICRVPVEKSVAVGGGVRGRFTLQNACIT